MITSEGLDLALNVLLGATTKPSFYVGFVSATSFTGFSSSDTMSSHTGWTEYTDYAESTRQQVNFGASSSGEITNPVSADITPNAATDLAGFFITTNSAKSGTTGVLFATAFFDQGTRSVQAGVTEQFTLNCSAVNSSSSS